MVFMMAQILQYGLTSIFDFATFLAEELHKGFICIVKKDFEKPFGWYSLVMHICLYKGSSAFGRDMVLGKVQEGVEMPVQLWNADVTWEATDASFVRFDNFFAATIRKLVFDQNPRIPLPLLQLIRPVEYPSGKLVCHNWADIFPYPISTVFRVYGFQGSPHVLPFQVPYKLGVSEFLW